MAGLVLSIFPGIGLLDRAFEEQGFGVVRGPDLLWGGDIKSFHPPAGVFAGVIGGDPCQAHSRLEAFCVSRGCEPHEDLTGEYCRVVAEAQPAWFLRENVRQAVEPVVAGYVVRKHVLNARDFGSEQNRERGIWFGSRWCVPVDLWRWLEIEPLRPVVSERAVLASDGKRRSMLRTQSEVKRNVPGRMGHRYGRACELQGLAVDFLKDAPFTAAGRHHVLGNGVPLPMGRAIAAAVRSAAEWREREC